MEKLRILSGPKVVKFYSHSDDKKDTQLLEHRHIVTKADARHRFSCILKFKMPTERFVFLYTIYAGTAVAQLVEALRYKSEGRGFDSRWCHWNFSLT